MKVLVIKPPQLQQIIFSFSNGQPLQIDIIATTNQVRALPLEGKAMFRSCSARLDSLRWIDEKHTECEMHGLLLPSKENLRCTVGFSYHYRANHLDHGEHELTVHYN